MVGTLEEYVAPKQMQQPTGYAPSPPTRTTNVTPPINEQPLSDLDRAIVGQYETVQIRIPIHDVFKTRRAVQILAAVCQRVDVLTYEHKDRRQQQFLIAQELRVGRDRIKALERKKP